MDYVIYVPLCLYVYTIEVHSGGMKYSVLFLMFLLTTHPTQVDGGPGLYLSCLLVCCGGYVSLGVLLSPWTGGFTAAQALAFCPTCAEECLWAVPVPSG